MKTKLFHIIVLFLGGMHIFSLQAQERKLRKAEKKYDNYAYIDAAEIYEDVLASGHVSAEILQKLGNTYYFNADYPSAETRYAQLMELDGEVSPIYYLRYAQTLRAVGKNESAGRWFDRYAEAAQLAHTLKAIDYAALIQENSGRYAIENLKINTTGIDYGGGIFGDALVYASTGDSIQYSRNRTDGWSGLNYLSLKGASIEETDSTEFNKLGKGIKVKGDIGSKFHESSACFTSDGSTMYFTRNIRFSEREGEAPQILKIYRATYDNGKWKEVEGLSINSNSYSTAHPALSPEEDKLYFASDRPGGKGETDLYVVSIDEDGQLGNPENLGDEINTPGKETFPFVGQGNELYFSSDGHYGLGGLDVFYIQLPKEEGDSLGHLLNVGEPVNSPYDDFAYTVQGNTNKGFFSSNRTGGQANGHDDIYGFVEKEKIKDLLKALICGQVTDKDTGEPIAEARVSLLDESNAALQATTTDSLGNYCMEAERYRRYLVRAAKETYDSDEQMVATEEEKTIADFELKRNQVALEPGQDLAKVLNIPIIYFDFDKSNIRPDAAVELEKVVAALKKYPGLKIDIRSHTDSRGSDVYNESLSERRAQSTLRYMVGQGVDAGRLTAKGYGESRLVNDCGNGAPCTKEQHQLNRRSEFIVVE